MRTVARGGQDAPGCHARSTPGGAEPRLPGGSPPPERVSGAPETGVAAKQKRVVASERQAQPRQPCRREVAEVKVNDFVFGAEMGSNLAGARAYGRAAPGERVGDTHPSTRGDTLSVIGALGADAVRAALRVPGAVAGDLWLVFTTAGLAPCLHPGTSVLMDKVPTHQRPASAAAIPAVGARVKFLPPSSPDCSPIENCWSKVKTFLRSVAARTQKDRAAALSNALATITRDDIKGWFAHCGYVDALN